MRCGFLPEGSGNSVYNVKFAPHKFILRSLAANGDARPTGVLIGHRRGGEGIAAPVCDRKRSEHPWPSTSKPHALWSKAKCCYLCIKWVKRKNRESKRILRFRLISLVGTNCVSLAIGTHAANWSHWPTIFTPQKIHIHHCLNKYHLCKPNS